MRGAVGERRTQTVLRNPLPHTIIDTNSHQTLLEISPCVNNVSKIFTLNNNNLTSQFLQPFFPPIPKKLKI